MDAADEETDPVRDRAARSPRWVPAAAALSLILGASAVGLSLRDASAPKETPAPAVPTRASQQPLSPPGKASVPPAASASEQASEEKTPRPTTDNRPADVKSQRAGKRSSRAASSSQTAASTPRKKPRPEKKKRNEKVLSKATDNKPSSSPPAASATGPMKTAKTAPLSASQPAAAAKAAAVKTPPPARTKRPVPKSFGAKLKMVLSCKKPCAKQVRSIQQQGANAPQADFRKLPQLVEQCVEQCR